ncbi:hypothetical protein PIB30_008730 [Stylosanthes scabra]|uniref:Uncharacterized protein n=1 Tax=Stylosanthes scabra TaxID=79078 RepID=A0ABU6V7E3_9FABA|nr:hypothetical protein [Stylosanthes scabra]
MAGCSVAAHRQKNSCNLTEKRKSSDFSTHNSSLCTTGSSSSLHQAFRVIIEWLSSSSLNRKLKHESRFLIISCDSQNESVDSNVNRFKALIRIADGMTRIESYDSRFEIEKSSSTSKEAKSQQVITLPDDHDSSLGTRSIQFKNQTSQMALLDEI